MLSLDIGRPERQRTPGAVTARPLVQLPGGDGQRAHLQDVPVAAALLAGVRGGRGVHPLPSAAADWRQVVSCFAQSALGIHYSL